MPIQFLDELQAPTAPPPAPVTPPGVPTAEEEALQRPEIEGMPGTSSRMTPGQQWEQVGKGLLQLPGVILDPEFWGSMAGTSRYLKGKEAVTGPAKALESAPAKAAEPLAEVKPASGIKYLDEPAPAPGIKFLDEPPPIASPIAGEVVPKYAGSVNLSRIKTDDDVKRAILDASKTIPKREPISDQTLIESAAKQGFTLEDAEKFAQTTQSQRAKFLATRNVHTALAEQYQAAKQAWVASDTPETYEALKQANVAFLRGFKASQDVASEAGLALSSFRIGSTADITTQANKTINSLMVELQKKGPISDELTKRMATLDLSNAEQANAFIKELSTKTASMGEKIYEAWLNAILSGPQTHAANISGNIMNLSLRPFDRVGSAAVDIGRAAVTGTPRERFASEAALDTWGMASSLPDASRAFLASARNNLTTYGTKIETAPQAKIGGVVGEVVRTPTKLLQATDEFFKALSSEGSKRVMAYREAAAEGMSGLDRIKRMHALIESPTETMQAGMKDEALKATFQTDLGRWGKAAIHFRDEIEPLKYIMPFIKTPTNIAKAGLSRTPLGWLDTAADVYKGQLPKGGALSDDLSKKLIGTGLSAWIAVETVSGNITGGGPADPDMRKALMDTGWRPYSLKVGDTYYPYNRFEPLATWMGTVADATELMQVATDGEQKEIVQKLSQAAAKNLVDKTYVQGMAEMGDALHDPGRYGEKFVSGRLSAVIPSVIGQAAKAADPEMREARGLIDAIKARIPGQRETLNPKRNLYGEPIEQPGGFWLRYLSPTVPSKESGTPGQLAIVESGADIGGLSRTLTVGNRKIPLDDDQYDRLQVLSGEGVKMLVEPMAASPSFSRMTKESQQEQLKHMVEKGRALGRARFIAEERLSPKKDS